MGKISSTIFLVLMLAVGASAQPKGKDGGKGKGKGDGPFTTPEPSGVIELGVAGAGAALLAMLLRRQKS